MATERLEIIGETVTRALKVAADGSTEVVDFADTRIPGFVLRVRQGMVSWLFKTRTTSKKLGAPPKMGVRDARKAAEAARAAYATRKPAENPSEEPRQVWTWSELTGRYVAHISGPRIRRGKEKTPSKHTIVDAKRALNRPALQEWNDKPVTSIGVEALVEAINTTINEVSYRQADKLFAYTRSALTWAYSNNTKESGLRGHAWWQAVRMPEPTGDIVKKIVASQRPTAILGFGPKEIAIVLHAHESFCQGRFGRDRISPSVRWGLWWSAFTVMRRGAATALLRSNLRLNDAKLPEDWALAIYSAEAMKGKREFWMPVTPMGVRILQSVQREWREAVNKTHGAANRTKWVFASNRRLGRDDSNGDVCLSESSLNTHLENMRGNRNAGHRDHLKGLPKFTVHSFRAAAATYLIDRSDIQKGAASAFLGHALAGDSEKGVLALSPTTKAFYDLAQHVPAKVEAMTAWTDAILTEYEKLGGIIPV